MVCPMVAGRRPNAVTACRLPARRHSRSPALASVPYRRRVARDSPAIGRDLPPVVSLLRAPHVVAAVPLKPPARILRANPSVPPPYGERLRCVDAEIIQFRVVAFGAEPCAGETSWRETRRGSRSCYSCRRRRQAQHGFRRQLRRKPGRERFTDGFGPPVDVPALHLVVDDDFALHGTIGNGRSRSPRSARSAIRRSMPRNIRP